MVLFVLRGSAVLCTRFILCVNLSRVYDTSDQSCTKVSIRIMSVLDYMIKTVDACDRYCAQSATHPGYNSHYITYVATQLLLYRQVLLLQQVQGFAAVPFAQLHIDQGK